MKNCLVKIICSATVRIAQLVEQSKKQQSCSVNSFYWGGTSDSAGHIILNSSPIISWYLQIEGVIYQAPKR